MASCERRIYMFYFKWFILNRFSFNFPLFNMQNVTVPPFFLPSPGEPILKWNKWKKVIGNYARVCGTHLCAERKHALLLHCLGAEGQEVLENLLELSREEVRNLNEYEIMVKKLDLHYLPRVSTVEVEICP